MLATLGVVLVFILGLGFYVQRTAGGGPTSSTGGSPSGAASATAGTSVSAAASSASCGGLHFGPALTAVAPGNPPSGPVFAVVQGVVLEFSSS